MAPILNKDFENEAARALVFISMEFFHQPWGFFVCLFVHLPAHLLKISFGA